MANLGLAVMTARYQPILATLAYICDKDRVLMVHRISRVDDEQYGKYNGLGGKLHQGEDIVTGLKREVFEESGLIIKNPRLAGTINWPGFGKSGEDWFGFIFLIDDYEGECKSESEEGPLCWVEKDQILSLNLWEGDKYFLPLVFATPLRSFHGVMPYRDGRPLSWTYQRLS